MNIFENYKNEIISLVEKNKSSLNVTSTNNYENIVVETPPDKFDSDLSTNICLILGKKNNINPKNLAEEIKKIIEKNLINIDQVNIAGPGFLNIRLSNDAKKKAILEIFKDKMVYGSLKSNKSINIEYVSANPTGPMHIGHCRGAIYGDVLSNLLKFNGNKVDREYYINDYGNQIVNFTKSVFLRIKELKYKDVFVNEKDLYPGEYIVDIAKKIIKDFPKEKFENFKKDYDLLSKKSLEYSMELIKSDLNKLGIKHDIFFSEKSLFKKDLVNKSIKQLKSDKFVDEGILPPPRGEETKEWKKVKRLVFKSTLFGDDIDRALQKNDGTWTYFANDLAYHADKISRNYSNLINVLGADHTGYIKRISAAVQALSKNKVKLDCKVCQLVKLFKKGQPYKMSKRAGEFITVGDLLREVNKDSIRFMMLNRSNDVEIDFDFDKVLEKSKENPVFYVQYCYARINSLFRTLKLDLNEKIIFDDKSFDLNDYEKKLLRKVLDWPKIIEAASSKYEPHRIPFYLYDLATVFHSYWSKGNEIKKYKFIVNNKIKNINTLAIIKVVAITLEIGMKILGVSLPKKM